MTEQTETEKTAIAKSGKLSEQELVSRYQMILDTFGQFGVPVLKPREGIEKYIEGPASILYKIRPGDGIATKKIYERADDLKLKLELEEEQKSLVKPT